MRDAFEAGPRDGRAVGIGRVGRGERDGAQRSRVGESGEFAQPVDGGGCRELRCSELLDDVPAPAVAGLLESGQHAVGLGEPAGKPLGLHGAARDDAVAIEEEARRRPSPARRASGSGARKQRPAPADGRRTRWDGCCHGANRRAPVEAGARRLPRDAVGLRAAGDERADGGERVVGDSPRPRQAPERLDDRLLVLGGRRPVAAARRSTRRRLRARRAAAPRASPARRRPPARPG